MKHKYVYPILYSTALIMGILIWKFHSPPQQSDFITEQIDPLGSSAHSDSIASNTIVAVNDEEIPRDELEWELALHTKIPQFKQDDDKTPAANSPKAPTIEPVMADDTLKQRMLVTMMERKILYAWITGHSVNFDHDNPSRFISCLADFKEISESNPTLVSTPKSRDRLKSRLCQQGLIDQYLHERIYGGINVSDHEISEWYTSHKSEFFERPKVTFRQVLLNNEATAQMVRAQITRNNFGELAKKYSTSPEATQGGQVGPFSKEQLPTFFDIVFNMQIGEISGVVRSDYGFHILMPIERTADRTLSLNDARARIRRRLTEEKRKEAYQSWLNTVMNSVSISSPNSEGSQ